MVTEKAGNVKCKCGNEVVFHYGSGGVCKECAEKLREMRKDYCESRTPLKFKLYVISFAIMMILYTIVFGKLVLQGPLFR